MSLLRILHVNSSRHAGGGDRIARLVDGALAKSFFESELFYPRDNNETVLQFFSALFQLCLHIKKKHPDILHAHGIRAALMAKAASYFSKEKLLVVYTVHGFHHQYRGFFVRHILYAFERVTNHAADAIIAVSENDYRALMLSRIGSSEKISLITNGIDVAEFQRSMLVASPPTPRAAVQPLLLMIARLKPPKDFITVLRALPRIRASFPWARLVIAGDGPLREYLQAYCVHHALGDSVSFLGERTDIPTLMRTATIVLFSSDWEGLPLVPIEAGAAGKAVVASDLPSLREIIVNGETGILFEKKNHYVLANCVIKLLKDPECRESLGRNAHERVKNFFSHERMAGQYMSLYRTLYERAHSQ